MVIGDSGKIAVLFRVDAGPGVGMGHLMRSFALARGMVDHGWLVTYASQINGGIPRKVLEAERIPLIDLPDKPVSDDWEILIESPIFKESRLIVVDSYRIGKEWLERCRPKKILVIDDLPNRFFEADLTCNVKHYNSFGFRKARGSVTPIYFQIIQHFVNFCGVKYTSVQNRH